MSDLMEQWAKVDEETVALFRDSLTESLDKMEEIRPDDEGWQRAVRWMRWQVLGDEQGCVITSFDRRGPKLRQALTDSGGSG